MFFGPYCCFFAAASGGRRQPARVVVILIGMGVGGCRQRHAMRARECAEVVVERVVLFDDDDDVFDRRHERLRPQNLSRFSIYRPNVTAFLS